MSSRRDSPISAIVMEDQSSHSPDVSNDPTKRPAERVTETNRKRAKYASAAW